nr:hypothetical protein [Tanacetum cinerariifolium]
MMHFISSCHIFIPAMRAYSFIMHHLASLLPSMLHAFCMVSYKGDLYKLLLMQVMAAPTILVSVKENLGAPIDIRVDIIHLKPVTAVAFPTTTVVSTLAQHEEAIRGMHGRLLAVPIQEKLTALRFRARIKIEKQLAAVQESYRQERTSGRSRSS